MNPDLTCKIGNITCRNPLLAASGTFGFGEEWADYINLNRIGGLVTKGLSLLPRHGNPPPRVWETASGMLNAIGLANPGLDAFVEHKLPFLQNLAKNGCLVAVNLYGESQEEFVKLAQELSALPGIGALELNLSCPNVKEGGMAFGVEPDTVLHMTSLVREVTSLPLWVKLSPNVTNIAAIARAAAHGGADAVSLINTLLAMSIDARARRTRLGNNMGGLSGPAIKPVALRMVYQVSREVDIPVIGLGGISSGEDVAEFFLAGACAVQIGTANFMDPTAMNRILDEFEKFCIEQGIERLNDLCGALQLHGQTAPQ